ncbi:MAG: multicopper oxidase domain-containing protein [Crocinitomicaceae bacterium]
MKNYLYILIFLFFSSVGRSLAQDTTIQLVSKMDIQPNYTFWDGNQTMLMGYTQLLGAPIELPSPTIMLSEGDSVELKLRNFSQPAPHTIHLHGLDVDQQNDGVPHLSFQVNHGENKSYFFKAPHPGTYIYHCHVFSSLHVQGGMYGLLIVKPSQPNMTWNGGFSFDKDYSWLTSEIDSNWHTNAVINQSYDSTIMSYAIPDYVPQYFLINGKSETQLNLSSSGIEANANQEIYLRLANIGFYGNRYIFPSALNTRIISSDGRPLPQVENNDTLHIYPGERYGVLLNSSSELVDSVLVDYLNLNTGLNENRQKVPVSIQGFAMVENLKISKFLVYPNPTDNILNISILEDTDRVEIIVFGLDGRELMRKVAENQEIKLQVGDLPKGIYVVRIEQDKNLLFNKLIVKK